ncbi:MAG: iron ABC transporter permease [Pseudomonadales bacterium]|nr:iron ABC transporter permease [Pseudomonadales bacterium]MBO7005511.1 iron ABC transporter permease [Pseudomonadales bacterium]
MNSEATRATVSSSFEVRRHLNPGIAALAVFLALVCTIAMSSGAVPLSVFDVMTGSATELETTIFNEIRSPRVLLAGFVGAALALAGAVLQGLFRNPLADPGLIGVSSGGALGAIAMIVLGAALNLPDWLSPYALPLAAIAGALAVTLFLYSFASYYGQFNIVTVLLVGIAINALATVGIGAFQYLSDDAQLRTLVFWMMGSFGRANWTTVLPSVVLISTGILILLRQAKNLDRMQLGEKEAFHLGVDVRLAKRTIILVSAAIVGAGVALSGIVAFVGLVVPHLIRLMLGAQHTVVLAGSALLGAALMILADLIARMIVAPAELPVSLVTSAIGAPFFLWLITRSKLR